MRIKSVTVGIALAFSTQAYASTIYTYSGNQFNEFKDDYGNIGGSVPGSYDTSMSVTGFFELTSSLVFNQLLTDLSSLVIDYEFTDGRNVLNTSNSFIEKFTFTTDSSGIVDWDLSILQNGFNDLVNNETTSRIITRTVLPYGSYGTDIFENGTTFTCLVESCIGVNSNLGVWDEGRIISNAGSWSASADYLTSDPLPTNPAYYYPGIPVTPPPVPIPSAVWLFGSGLIGLIGVARRKV